MRRPVAVQRREYISSTGPSIFGIKRMEKVVSPSGQRGIFLGVREGEVYLECEDKTAGEAFLTLSTGDFSRWTKVL